MDKSSGYIKIVLLSWVILSSCVATQKMKTEYSQFSEVQNEMIMSGDKNLPMRVYKINNKKDSILLRSTSAVVELPTKDKTLDHFVSRLYATVTDSASMGVGIAAPQVGVLKKIIWIQRFDKEGYPFEVYYNPEISYYSDEKQDCREGCLSIPNLMDTTKTRAKKIMLSHQLRSGEKVEEEVSDFTAVIFQHEIDHLDGILFIDHLKREQ